MPGKKPRKKPRKKPTRRARTKSKRPSRRWNGIDLESIVRAGVERFILKDSSILDFMKSLRVAGKFERVFSHQLTRAVFSRIVKQAIKEREQRLKERQLS